MFNFVPKIIPIDYSKSLRNALLSNEVFKTKPIIIQYFFHFVQFIVKKMKNLKLIKSRITKYSYEIIKNIELLAFIKPSMINDYIKFLKIHLKKDKEKDLFKYLDKNWFSRDINEFNYYEILDNNNLKETLSHFFATNNVAESLHSKMNQYLPNNKNSNTNFIISIRNIISNYELKKENIIRKVYVTRTLIEYSKTLMNNNFTWLTYNTFKNLEKNLIKNSNKTINDDDINEIIYKLDNVNFVDNHCNATNKNSDNNDKKEEEISNDNLSIISNEILSENNSENESDKDLPFTTEENKYKIPNLYERLLEAKNGLKIKDLINELNIKNKL